MNAHYEMIALLAIAIFDAGTTYVIIKRGGREVNPVLVELAKFLARFTNAKWAWLVIAKVVGHCVMWWLFTAGQYVALNITIAIYCAVIVSNFYQITRQKR
jgi:hypothetical protein